MLWPRDGPKRSRVAADPRRCWGSRHVVGSAGVLATVAQARGAVYVPNTARDDMGDKCRKRACRQSAEFAVGRRTARFQTQSNRDAHTHRIIPAVFLS